MGWKGFWQFRFNSGTREDMHSKSIKYPSMTELVSPICKCQLLEGSNGTTQTYTLREDISAEDISAEDISAEDISAEDISAEDISAEDIFAEDIFAEDIFAEDIFAEDIFANLGQIRENIFREIKVRLRIRENIFREIFSKIPFFSKYT